MICITCEHGCHCGDICQADNGCGCPTCEHGEGENMLKKLWRKIKDWLGILQVYELWGQAG